LMWVLSPRQFQHTEGPPSSLGSTAHLPVEPTHGLNGVAGVSAKLLRAGCSRDTETSARRRASGGGMHRDPFQDVDDLSWIWCSAIAAMWDTSRRRHWQDL